MPSISSGAFEATKGFNAYQRIWRIVRAIPYGQVATYGQVAGLLGNRRYARLVGYALHKAPAEPAIPWHRVINARGRLSFPRDSEPYALQFDRLTEEGVEFVNGRVDLERFGWQPTLDELLWRPED